MTVSKWEDPRRILKRYGLRAKRGFSQNFMISPHAVDFIAAATVSSDNQNPVVVELGAGLGTLTSALLRTGAKVFAVEQDPDMLTVLQSEFSHNPHLKLINQNAVQIDFSAFCSNESPRICVAGNIPYAATGSIIRNLVTSSHLIQRAVLTLQREVSDRLNAKPASSEYGALTVFTAAAYQIQILRHLSPAVFHPAPKVDSTIIRLTPYRVRQVAETTSFVKVVRAAFQTRRKTLRNALLKIDKATPLQVDSALELAGIDGCRRGETLSIEEFDHLSKAWEKFHA